MSFEDLDKYIDTLKTSEKPSANALPAPIAPAPVASAPDTDGLDDYLDQFKTPNKQASPKRKKIDLDVPRIVDEELGNLGWSPNARLSLLGNLGRENAWNADTIFKGHADPKNSAANLGIISWQGDRRTRLIDYLKQNGGDLTPNENNLRLMTRFMDDEIKSSPEWRDIHGKVRSPNISTKEASQLFRRYIKYVPTAPYNTPDDEYDTVNNRNWAEKARKRGLASSDPLDTYLNQFAPQSVPAAAVAEIPESDPLQVGGNVPLEYPTPENMAKLGLQFPTAGDASSQPVPAETEPQPVYTLGEIEGVNPFPAVPPQQSKTLAEYESSLLYGNPNDQLQHSENPSSAAVSNQRKAQTPDAEYQKYLKYTQKTDSPENRSEYEKLLQSDFGKNVDVSAEINNPAVQPVPNDGTLLQNESRNSQVIKTDADLYKAQAGITQIDLSKKPKGTDNNEYAFRAALKSIGSEFGLTDEQIEKVIADKRAKGVFFANNSDLSKDSGAVNVALSYGSIIEALGGNPENIPDVVRRKFRSQQADADLRLATSENSLGKDEFGSDVKARDILTEDSRKLAELKRRENPDYVLYKDAERQLTDQANADPYNASSIQPTHEEILERAQIIKDAQADAAELEKIPVIGSLAAGFMGGAGRTYQAIAGISRPLTSIFGDAPYKLLQNIGNKSVVLGEATNRNGGTGSSVLKGIGGMPVDISRLLLLSRLPGGAVVGFAADAGLQSAGRGENLGQIVGETGKGAALGALFGGASKLAQAAENGTLRAFVNPVFDAGKKASAGQQLIAKVIGETTRIGTIGTGTFTIEKVSGASNEEALYSAITNAIFDLTMQHGNGIAQGIKDLAGKVFRTWKNGKPHDVTLTSDGEVKLLKGQTKDDYIDAELILDPTDNVYKVKEEAAAGKKTESETNIQSERIATSQTPRELLGENPKRIESPNPEAVQKASVDTRAQKIVETLKGKDSVSVEELQKLTRYNQKNVEEAVMLLYGAKQVEILPDNSVRFIGGEQSTSGKSLFERVDEITAPKDPVRLSKSPIEQEISRLTVENDNGILPNQSADLQPVKSTVKSPAAPAPVAQTETKITGPQAKVLYAERPNTAAKLNVFSERGTQASIEPKVIDSSDLLTSLDESYPSEFQPRDRSRAASKAQISQIANKINPEFLGDSPKASDGRPLVVPVEMPDGKIKYAVISGNGRSEGIRSAYALGKAEGYREFVQSKDSSAAGFDKPVYVGILDPNEIKDLPEFAKEANESATAQMSATEQARSDAERIDSDVLNLFVPSDDGTIHGAANRDFTRAFLQRAVPASEQGRLVDAEGKLNQDGAARVRNAIFAKAFGDTEKGLSAIQRMSESTDNNVKNITSGLLAKAGGLASLKEAAKAGTRHKEFDIAPDLATAMEKYAFLRESGTTVEEFIQQGNLFGSETTPLQTRIIQVFDNHKRSPKAIRTIISNFLAIAEEAGDPNQVNLFGETAAIDPGASFEAAVRFYEEQNSDEEQNQSDLFENQELRLRPESSGTSVSTAQTESGIEETAQEITDPAPDSVTTNEPSSITTDEVSSASTAQRSATKVNQDSDKNTLEAETTPETDKTEKQEKKDEKPPREFSSTQVNLPSEKAREIVAFAKRLIPKSELAEDGYEEDQHITAKFGTETNDVDDIKRVVAGVAPFWVTLGKISIFDTNPDFDVVKLDVDSPELHRINKLIGDNLKNGDTHPVFKPHETLAYVKKGEGAKYVGNSEFEGTRIYFDKLIFSDKNRNKIEIPLGKQNSPAVKSESLLVADLPLYVKPNKPQDADRLAPNGKKSNLPEHLYNLVRTEKFKNWFGDWELFAKPDAQITNISGNHFGGKRESALDWAKKNLRGEKFQNKDTGFEITISGRNLNKALSESAVKNKSLREAHYEAVRGLGVLLEQAILGESYPDRNNDPNIEAIHRLYAPIEVNGRVYRAKLTVKEYKREPVGLYSYELAELEMLDVMWTAGTPEEVITARPSSISIANLLQGATKNNGLPFSASKVIDENGEPLVVSHGTDGDFDIFDLTRAGKTDEGFAGKGFYFTNADSIASDYGKKTISGFLNLKNPLVVKEYAEITNLVGVTDKRDRSGKVSDAIRLGVISKGYDGIVVEDTDANNQPVNEYVAFKPNQIKSISNNGEFSPDNDSILYNRQKNRSGLSAYGSNLPLVEKITERVKSNLLTEADFVKKTDSPAFDKTPSNLDALREDSLYNDLYNVFQRKHSVETLLEKAEFVNDNGVLFVNPEGFELLRRANQIAFSDPDLGVFYGAYLNPRHAERVSDALRFGVLGGRLDYYAKVKANSLRKTFDDTISSRHKDLIVIATNKTNKFGLEKARQEELAHRSDYRIGLQHSVGKNVMMNSPAGRMAISNLQNGAYEGASDGIAALEVTAKLFVDGNTELGIPEESKQLLRHAYIDSLLENDVLFNEIEQEFENISSNSSKETVEYAREKQKERELQRGTRDFEPIEPGRKTPISFYGESPEGTRTRSRSDSLSDFDRQSGNFGTGFLEGIGSSNQAIATFSRAEIEKLAENEITYSKPSSDKWKVGDIILDALSAPKSVKSSMDLSAAGRQGFILSLTEPQIALKAFKLQIKSLSEKHFEKFKRNLNLHKYIELAEDSGLYLSNLVDQSSLSEREEQFLSRLFSDDPVFKNRLIEKTRRGITLPIRASERAYTTYLDGLRIESFAKFAREIHEYNVRKGKPDDIEQYKAIATFINYATGRGDLGKLNDAAPLLNATFFSARYWASRLQLMNPFFYGKLPPGARKIALRKMAGFLGGFALIMLLGKLGGADIEYDDPNNPNALKLKFSNWSYDFGAGLIQHGRYISRMINAFGEKDQYSKQRYLTERYVRSKLSPVPGSAANLAEGKTFMGEPTDLKTEAFGLVKPIMLDNFNEAIKAEGESGVIKMIPEFFGIGGTRFKNPDEYKPELEYLREQLKNSPGKDEKIELQRKIKIYNNLINRSAKNDRKEKAQK